MKHKKIFREDRFLVLDLDGKVLHEQLASKLFEQTKTTPLDWPINAADASVIGKGIEISHFNSFYEIPKIEMGNPPHYLKQGNFIVNGHSSGVYILSSDLKEVLHYFTWEESCEHAIHDVQVTKRGHILLFNNRTFNHGCDFTRIFTTIVEVDPVHKNILHKFVDSPPRNFYAHGMGSVQEVDEDTWLFSHPSTGTYIYSKSKDKIFLKIPSTHMREGKPIPTQQSKLQDLSSFLSFWNQDF